MLALSDASLPEFYEELLASVLAAFMVCEGQKLTWKCGSHLETEKEFKIILHWISCFSFWLSVFYLPTPQKKKLQNYIFVEEIELSWKVMEIISQHKYNSKQRIFPSQRQEYKNIFLQLFAEEFSYSYLWFYICPLLNADIILCI